MFLDIKLGIILNKLSSVVLQIVHVLDEKKLQISETQSI